MGRSIGVRRALRRLSALALCCGLGAGMARADCLLDGDDVVLTGEARRVFWTWFFEADEARCLVALLDEPTRDGLARFEMLPGEWRIYALDWRELHPAAGRVVLEGYIGSLPAGRRAAGAGRGGGPPFRLSVEAARPAE